MSSVEFLLNTKDTFHDKMLTITRRTRTVFGVVGDFIEMVPELKEYPAKVSAIQCKVGAENAIVFDPSRTVHHACPALTNPSFFACRFQCDTRCVHVEAADDARVPSKAVDGRIRSAASGDRGA